MATTAWMFVTCPDSLEFRDNPSNPELIQARVVRRFNCTRIHTGASSMPATAAGSVLTGTPSASIGSSTITGSNIDSLKWVCVANNTEMQGPVGTDALKQSQTWETYSEWEDFSLEDA